ncbi:hypothetical protein JVT61DRAFT_7902 [Boletus reticuloceps]|uniref:Uncharacterized protein n=1 Tax=Boletus reticuloceps TaxID=495285 RepID=A0A8I3A6L5_9AGAM|nr:hypothetical protein JVT61DRAFT_7902 [Boletus reticuloceps]
MAPMKWTILEQVEFLTGLYPKYLEHTMDKSYHQFWAELYTKWFARWPKRATLFPNIEGVLNAEQGKALGAAVDMHKKLQQKKSSVFEKVLAPKGSCICMPTELYMLEHYDDRIKPQIMAEQQAGRIPTFRNNLTVVHKYAQELLESEDSKIKEKIKFMYEMQEKVSKATCDSDSEEETDPAEIKCTIDDLPYMLTRVAKLVKRCTCFAISFVCTGPDPSRNWEISQSLSTYDLCSCHPDMTPSGCTFPSLFPRESNAMLITFQEYAETIFMSFFLVSPSPESRNPTKSEKTLGVLPADKGCNNGDVAIEDSGDDMENRKTEEGGSPESENQCGAGDKGTDDAEGEKIDKGGQGYGAAIVEGDEWQVTSDAGQSFVGLDASFGTWSPSGTAGPSPNQSIIQFNASMQLQDPATIGLQVGLPHAFCSFTQQLSRVILALTLALREWKRICLRQLQL